MNTNPRSWFSLAPFGVALLTVAIGAFGGMQLIPLVGSYLGILLGGFAAGLAFERRPFLEVGIAGLLVGTVATVIQNLGLGLITIGPQGWVQIALLGAVLGFGLGATGAHFGNDLRDGLTRPVES